jgi:hypothetical protein
MAWNRWMLRPGYREAGESNRVEKPATIVNDRERRIRFADEQRRHTIAQESEASIVVEQLLGLSSDKPS